MPNRVTTKTLTLTAATAASTDWLPTNTRVPDVQVSLAAEASLGDVAPLVRVEGTFQDVLVSASVAATRVYEIASAAATSAVGVSIVDKLDALPAAIRMSTISGGSGASTLTFSVIQTGF